MHSFHSHLVSWLRHYTCYRYLGAVGPHDTANLWILLSPSSTSNASPVDVSPPSSSTSEPMRTPGGHARAARIQLVSVLFKVFVNVLLYTQICVFRYRYSLLYSHMCVFIPLIVYFIVIYIYMCVYL